MTSLFKNRILEEDLNSLVNKNIDYKKMENSTVLVTGATGLIGVSFVRSLIYLNQKENLNIHIILLIRNAEKARRIYGELLSFDYISIISTDISLKITIDSSIDYIIHCASVTSSKMMIDKPVETIVTSVYGTKNILDLAKEKKCKSVVYISSMEMYGTIEGDNTVAEEDLGYIDPLKVRSNYPESKRLCENMCIGYLNEYNVPVKIARLSQTFGAGILDGENRIFAQFAKCVVNNENIVLHTDGSSEGNYCYLSDCLLGLYTILLYGNDGEAYNVVNDSTHTTIRDMAEMVCRDIANGRIQVVYDIDCNNKFGYASKTKLKLTGKKLMSLGWKPEVDLQTSYVRLIQSLIEKKEKGE